MRIYKAKDYNEMSRKAANIISAQIIMKPDAVLGLATGSSPIGTYKQLIDWYNKGDLDFSEIRSVNLDEYKGLDASNHKATHILCATTCLILLILNQKIPIFQTVWKQTLKRNVPVTIISSKA